MIRIHKFRDRYVGEKFSQGASTGEFALLRVPGLQEEAEEIGNFMRLNESYTEFLPLSEELPAFYPPDKLFANWEEFPELHQTKVMAWDSGGSPGLESQWVRTFLKEYREQG